MLQTNFFNVSSHFTTYEVVQGLSGIGIDWNKNHLLLRYPAYFQHEMLHYFTLDFQPNVWFRNFCLNTQAYCIFKMLATNIYELLSFWARHIIENRTRKNPNPSSIFQIIFQFRLKFIEMEKCNIFYVVE